MRLARDRHAVSALTGRARNRRLSTTLAGILLLTLAWPAQGQGRTAGAVEAFREYFDRLSRLGFSGVAAVGKGDSLAFLGAYGLANRELNRPNQPNTVFTIGSITKPFTALLVVGLASDGVLSLDEPMATYIPGVPDDKRGITLRQLLTHTSGLKRSSPPDADGGTDFEATREYVVRDALESELIDEPGARFHYSNLGYTLLAVVAENATGSAYEELLYERVLGPAEMLETGYYLPDYADDRLAWGYTSDEEIRPVIRLPGLSDGPSWVLRANGGLHSSARDMFLWYEALRSGTLLEPPAQKQMITPAVSQGDGLIHYALGWDTWTGPDGRRIVSHSGGNPFFGAHFQWHPDDDLMVFVASNEAERLHFGRLAEHMASLAAGDTTVLPPRVRRDAGSLAPWLGRYVLPTGGLVAISRRDGETRIDAVAGDDAYQFLQGGTAGRGDARVAALAARSRDLVRAEYDGDLGPKFQAMGGTTAMADLERYRRYDVEYWNENFGELQRVGVVAAAGERDVVEVVVRMTFERGASGIVHTWRAGRLANISVHADWESYNPGRRIFAVDESREAQSYEHGATLRLRLHATLEGGRVEALRAGPTGVRAHRAETPDKTLSSS